MRGARDGLAAKGTRESRSQNRKNSGVPEMWLPRRPVVRLMHQVGLSLLGPERVAKPLHVAVHRSAPCRHLCRELCRVVSRS